MIKDEKWVKAKRLENEIAEYLKENDRKVSEPVTAFVTFKHEDGVEQINHINEESSYKCDFIIKDDQSHSKVEEHFD